MKISAVGAELFHANLETDGQADKQTNDALISRLSQFYERA